MKNYIKDKLRNRLLIESLTNIDCPFLLGNEDDEYSLYETLILSFNKSKLDEGLIKSYPLNFVVQRLGDYGIVKLIQNHIYLQLNYEYLDNIAKFISYINSLGYFVSQYKILPKGKEVNVSNYIDYKKLEDLDIKNIEQLWVVIEAKFDGIEENKTEFIYHLTENKYLDKIRSKGLIPKSKAKKAYHPDRLYVVNDIHKLKDLLTHFTMNGTNVDDYCVLKIDYDKCNKPTLYNDPNYIDMGYYIIDNISANSIVSIINVSQI